MLDEVAQKKKKLGNVCSRDDTRDDSCSVSVAPCTTRNK